MLLRKIYPGAGGGDEIYGFTESNGDWSGLSDSILFDKNDYRLRPDSRQQITTMASRLAATGSP